MTTAIEMNLNEEDKDTKRKAKAVSGGIFLIGLAILLYTGWWWPGIMFVIGLSSCAEFIFQGKISRGIGSLALFFGIPIGIWVIQETEIPWSLVGPLVLAGVGVIVLLKAFFLRDKPA